MANHAAGVDDQLRGAAADIEQAAAQLAFVLREHGIRRGQRLERGVADHDAGAIDGGDHVLRRRDRRRDDVHVYFQALPDHADGIADVVLLVDQKFLRQHMQNFAVFGKRNGARGVHGPAHVLLFDIARAGAQRNSPSAIHSAHVAAGNADHRRLDRHVGHAFRFLERAADGADRGIQIDDQALARSFGLSRAHSQEARAAILNFGYQRARFGAADVQRDQIALLLPH